MFGKIRSEFYYLEGEGKNWNVCNDKTGISVFERIRSEFQCLEG